jgi:hypothetical protein
MQESAFRRQKGRDQGTKGPRERVRVRVCGAGEAGIGVEGALVPAGRSSAAIASSKQERPVSGALNGYGKPIPYDESLTEKQPGNRRSSTLL